jgi:hypothetical protein
LTPGRFLWTRLTVIKDIQRTLYRLKRRYGTRFSLMSRTGSTNVETGVKDYTVEKLDIPKAIVLEAREFRMFVYDLAFISANKDFTMGGYFDPSDRKVIIDAKDIPKTWKLTNDQFAVCNGVQYQVVEIHEHPSAYMLLVRAIRGQNKIQLESVVSTIILEDSANGIADNGKTITSSLAFTQTVIGTTKEVNKKLSSDLSFIDSVGEEVSHAG